jgi:hypothetical protein
MARIAQLTARSCSLRSRHLLTLGQPCLLSLLASFAYAVKVTLLYLFFQSTKSSYLIHSIYLRSSTYLVDVR